MIYIKNIPLAQIVRVPKSRKVSNPAIDGTLTLRNTTAKGQTLSFSVHFTTERRQCYDVTITLGNYSYFPGEYEYELKQGTLIVSTGLARLGELPASATPASGDGITFKESK